MIKYEVLSSGSKGNCIIVNDYLMLDCGLPYSKIKDYLEGIKIIFICHSHGDHFKKTTIKKIAFEKPNIKFIVGNFLVADLVLLGVNKKNIITFDTGKWYELGIFKARMDYLFHDVPNNCLHIEFKNGEKLFYATDTSSIDHIKAEGYDLYLIEANYDEDLLEKHIEESLNNNYSEKDLYYLHRAEKTHLSSKQSYDFFLKNRGNNSKYQIIHQSQYNYKETD